MTVSRLEVALLLALCGLAACTTPAGMPPRSAFQNDARPAAPPPDVADQTAAELARAVLLSDPYATRRALSRMQDIDTVLGSFDDKSTGLLGVSTDLFNTTLDDDRAYRQATRRLLQRDGLDPALRARLELFENDDPLELARDRLHDAFMIDFGRAFNALAEPIGRSIMTSQLAPYRLGRSLINYAVEVYQQESLTLQRRQALAHWKTFLLHHPEAPEAEDIRPRVDAAMARWHRLHRDRSLRVAEKALEHDKVRLALLYADRALRHMPEDRRSGELRDEAAKRLLEIRERQRRAVTAGPEEGSALHPEQARALAVAMLRPGGDMAAAAQRLESIDPEGPLADEARFVRATALGEAGDSKAMWKTLEALAKQDGGSSNMSRHALAAVRDPLQNTYGAYRDARIRSYWDRARWLLFGPFYKGIPDRGLPKPVAWVLGAPSVAESVFSTPFRFLNLPWAAALPADRLAGVYARRHLERSPGEANAGGVREWLIGHEKKRGNFMAALELEEQQPDPDVRELAELREKAAEQYLRAALHQHSRGLRLAMYRRMANDFPGSEAAVAAGRMARQELEQATAQNIRLSRDFLLDNPGVAGPDGLGLRPELLDEDPTNAEIHPEGIELIGGRGIQISYLAESGDEDDPPRRRREALDAEHLSRIVSQLEETTYRNELLDSLDDVSPDAQRDYYFERVRLGLADEPDPRLTATSNYAYRGLRERYGMVRARESILPFDIVISGSLNSLSLGAFPRIRRPRETSDAILYK